MELEKYKYNVINGDLKEEAWTGVFSTKLDAEKWYEKYGKEHERNGYNLVLREL